MKIQSVVTAYQGLLADEQGNILIVAYTKKEVSTLNQAFKQKIKTANPDIPYTQTDLEDGKMCFITPEQSCIVKTITSVSVLISLPKIVVYCSIK